MNNRIIKNATWIIACRIIQALLNLVVSMITARYLGPSDLGAITYAASLVAFVVPLVQLGFNGILVQMFVDTPEESGKIIGTSTVITSFSSLLGVIGIWAFTTVFNRGETDTVIISVLYSVSMFFQMAEMIEYWYQSKLLSKYVSVISLISRVIVSVYKIYIVASGKSVYWFAVVNSFDFFIISAGLFIAYRKLKGQHLSFSWNLAKLMLSEGKHFIVSGMMISVFSQTDKIMLKLMIDDAASGFYWAAVSCASITQFLFSAIIDSMRPVIFANKKSSQQQYHKNTVLLYSIIIFTAAAQSVALTLFAKPVILILYGKAFLPSVPVLRIITWYSAFSYLGAARTIWFISEEKKKYLWITNIVGATVNLAGNLVLIPLFGAVGAAFASLLTQFITNFVLNFILKPLKENGRLLIEALNPSVLLQLLKKE